MIAFLAALVLISGLILAVLYVKWSHTFWSRKKVPFVAPTSIFGNVEPPLLAKRGLMLSVESCYKDLKRRNEKYGGMYMFTEPVFVPVDIDLIKGIFTRDFSHFLGHGFVFNEKTDPLSMHLFNLEGERWRNMRVQLTPTFTSGKMKMMFQTLVDCGEPMLKHVDGLYQKGELLDIKEILSCYTTDIIGSCAFGLECNSFKDPNAEFRSYGRRIFEPRLFNLLLVFLTFVAPESLLKSLPIKRIPIEVENFFIKAIRSIIDYRTTNGVSRNDFIQLFLEMRKKAEENGTKSLTITEISAQSFVFFLAGFETSSTTMTFCLHELAFNQDVQEKLRREVKEVLEKNDGKLTYDGIMEMKYMDKVLNETLRKYPPVPILNRVCSVDYKIPGTETVLKKGTKVFISNLGIHNDPEYYPDPERFDPERFSDEGKASRPSFTFLPFGEGPRICIGLRFGLMQAKTGLSTLLANYKILPGPEETYNIKFNPTSFILTKKGNVMLKVEKLKC